MKRTIASLLLAAAAFVGFAQSNHPYDQFGVPVHWDRHSLIIDGHRVVPVMGEIHYSRLPENEWAHEVRKMKEGGVTIIANYVFWNHVEEQQGIFDWSGQRSLRRFIEVCKAEGMPVCLRIGPYCHGEARCGGIPDWVVQSGCKLRSEDPQFLSYVEALYRQIFTQVQGLQWKDGGPVLACQFDNEFGGHGSYLMRLKQMANEIGFDLPFYTRTGWPALRTPTPFGEMIPLYGDYADGFWDRKITEGSGSYWKAFHFTASPTSGAIASEQLDYSGDSEEMVNGQSVNSKLQYPYFTCELGGGMMTSYHRRVYLYPEDAYAMALVKLGSGSNLLGYYMYHGGTNPDGHLTYLNECQKTPVTNHNDMPVKTYDFQAPLGEFGQKNPHYYSLRPLHLFMQDFGEQLACMESRFPCADKQPKQYDDSYLRWSYRTIVDKLTSEQVDKLTSEQVDKLTSDQGRADKLSGQGKNSSTCPAFVFVNNYERFAHLTAKKGVQFAACGVMFPRKPITIPAGTMTFFPVNLPMGSSNINWATAQPVANRDGKLWFEQKAGIAAEFCIDGKVRNVKKTSMEKPFATIGGIRLYLITTEQAEHLFLEDVPTPSSSLVALPSSLITKLREAGAPRTITIGVQKVAEEPVDADFEAAAVYRITLPSDSTLPTNSSLLHIRYRGDVARLYANGKLIADNFYNGRPFLMGLWRLPADVKELELRILPLQKDMPVYFPREADTTPGEQLISVEIGSGVLPTL